VGDLVGPGQRFCGRRKILNEVHGRSKYLIEDYKNAALRYADRKFFGNKLDVHPVIVAPIPKWGHT
jgi:hypothetical protein